MSVVTHVIVCVGDQNGDNYEEEDTLRRALLAPLECADGQRLAIVTEGPAGELWGGSKRPEVDVYAAAFNCLDIDDFSTWIDGLPWLNRSAVRVLICGQSNETFRVCVLGKGGLVEVVQARPR